MRVPFMVSAAGPLLVAALTAAAPQVSRVVLDNGLRLLVVEDHRVPSFTAVMRIGSGGLHDPTGQAGLASLTAELLRRGAGKRSAREVAEVVEQVGGSTGTSVSWDSSDIYVDVLARDRRLALELLADQTLRPTLASEELTRLKQERLSEIVQRGNSAEQNAGQALARFVLGDHPLGSSLRGERATVTTIDDEAVRTYFKRHYVAKNAILAVAGDLDPELVKQEVLELFGSMSAGQLSPPAPEPNPVVRGGRVLLLDRPDLTQAKIAFGHIGINRGDPDYYAAQVTNYILGGGGFSSRLVQKVRVEQGLTYNIGSRFSAHTVAGLFTVTTATAVPQAQQAVMAALDEIDRFRRQGPSDRELKEAKAYLIGSFPRQLETHLDVATVLLRAERYGLGDDFIERYPSYIKAVGKSDVKRVLTTALAPDAFRFVVVGPREGLEEQLRPLGEIESTGYSDWWSRLAPTEPGLPAP